MARKHIHKTVLPLLIAALFCLAFILGACDGSPMISNVLDYTGGGGNPGGGDETPGGGDETPGGGDENGDPIGNDIEDEGMPFTSLQNAENYLQSHPYGKNNIVSLILPDAAVTIVDEISSSGDVYLIYGSLKSIAG